MILHILQIYLTILLPIAAIAFTIFMVGVYFIFRSSSNLSQDKKTEKLESHDLTAIAGDDILATQLDLARALIETNQTQSAKQILKNVVKQGNAIQKQEAQQLMSLT